MTKRLVRTVSTRPAVQKASPAILALGGLTAVALSFNLAENNSFQKIQDVFKLPIACCIQDVGGIEPKTGISFPYMVDGLLYVGSGVRVKYGFVKVYAVGAYVDKSDVADVIGKGVEEISEKICDPNTPKTIRIVMNRGLSVDKYMAAIMEALEPRMEGVDLDKLDDFKKMNPPGDLKEGSEMIMTIRGDTMTYRSSEGGMGIVKSAQFTKALADVYFGKDPVSPALKTSVAEGVNKL